MRAIPDTRRRSPIPKYLLYLLLFGLVCLARGTWAREINLETSENQNNDPKVRGDDSSIIIEPVNSEGEIKNVKKDIREQKTIITEFPDKPQDIVKKRAGEEVASDDQEKVSENTNIKANDGGIRRFDVEVQNEEEEPLSSGQIIESVDDSDSVVVKTGDSEQVKSARDDSALHEESDSVQSPEISHADSPVESEIPNNDPVALRKHIEERNPYLKKNLIDKENGKEDDEGNSESSIRKLRSDAGRQYIQYIQERSLQLQKEIQNITFLQTLKDQQGEILPEIPSFTENQLLESLKLIVSHKKNLKLNETSHFNMSELSPLQQEILKCAEELMVQRQRQSFMNNMYQCIRSLSVMNCMRIFIYPILIENVPQSLAENFPIEINVADLVQGNRLKSKLTRREQIQTPDFLSPEWQIYTIFKTMLHNYPTNEKVDMYVDIKNDTLSNILSPNQILILQMGEQLLPETVRQEYSNQMFTCIRRYEYYSCMKYFAWPMLKHYLPTLPKFPNYYYIPQPIAEYPEFIPYPAFQTEIGQLPEIIDADGTRTRGPKPELIILDILQNAIRDQQNVFSPYPSYVDYESFNARVTKEQLESLRAAEQLLPAAARSDYASKTMSCINQYNYLHCIRHSTWPTVRKYTNIPKLPELQSLISDYTKFPSLSGYIPSLPNIPNFSSWLNKPHHPLFGGGSGNVNGTGTGGIGGTGGSGSGSFDPSGGISGQNPGYPVNLPFFPVSPQPGGPQPGGPQQPGLIPPYPFIPFIPYPWYPPQNVNNPQGDGSAQGGGGAQGGGSGIPWDPNQSASGSGSGTTGSGSGSGSSDSSVPGTGSGSDSGSNSDNNANVPGYPSAPCKSYLKEEEIYDQALVAWENELLVMLKTARDSVENISSSSYFFESNKIPLYLTVRQLNILRLSEDLLPADKMIRQDVTTKMLECLEENNLFANCLRIIMFPNIRDKVPSLPKLFYYDVPRGIGRADDNANINESENQRNNIKKISQPTISVTGTRFVSILDEHPESILYNILNSIRLSDSNLNEKALSNNERHDEISQILSERQEKILVYAAELIPVNMREEFINKTLLCALNHAFLYCSRQIIWPSLTDYVPTLPSFPNFDNIQEKKSHIISNAPLPFNPTLLETSVNNQGDPHITITDTRFIPVLSEQPETVILKILKAIEMTMPQAALVMPEESLINKNNKFQLLSSKQVDIFRTAENILPESARGIFIKRMYDCIESNTLFLDCTRDIAFPIIGQYHPSLPSFPQFGALKSDKILSHSEKILQTEIENALRHSSAEKSDWKQQAKMDHARAAVYSYPVLSGQQVNILQLSENLLPETMRLAYRAKMIDCIRTNSFLPCTQQNWPILRQYIPDLPEFLNTDILASQPYPLTGYAPTQYSGIPSGPQFAAETSIPTIVDRRTVLPYISHRMFRQINPTDGAAPTLVGER